MAQSIFGTVVEDLIKDSTYKYKSQLATDIGIPKSTFSNWIHGRHTPEYNAILAIAALLNTGKSKKYRYIVFRLVDALAEDEDRRQTQGRKR